MKKVRIITPLILYTVGEFQSHSTKASALSEALNLAYNVVKGN